MVLGEIRRLTKFASLYEDDFLKAVIGHSQQADEADRKLKEKELKALLARDEELDGLFERIYEDNVSGKISDERFSRMSRRAFNSFSFSLRSASSACWECPITAFRKSSS